jgi:hypothetical protein
MKGILFKEEIFKAIIDGKKTQTRRILKPQPIEKATWIGTVVHENHKIGFYWSDGTTGNMQGFWPGLNKNLFPKYQPGEILYLKEPYYLSDEYSINYKYDYPDYDRDFYLWQNKLFMPEKYARYFIKITDVRCERLQDISVADARAEGVKEADSVMGDFRPGFLKIWDKIHGVESWNENPWVWVVEFERIMNVEL